MAIGAIKFDPFKPKALIEQFFQSIDPVSCTAHGMKLDATKVMWWMGMQETYNEVASRRIVDLGTGLYGFTDWVGKESPIVWGAGPTDIPNLRRAYELIGDEAPWNQSHERCTQTIAALAEAIEVKARNEIDPVLTTAANQVGYIQAVVKKLGLTRL